MKELEKYSKEFNRLKDKRIMEFEIDDNWKQFHESKKHKVSVVTGRQLGKTHNTIIKALSSIRDVIIYSKDVASSKMLAERIMGIINEKKKDISNEITYEIYEVNNSGVYNIYDRDNLKNIKLMPISSLSNRRGHVWFGKVIIIDEFDNPYFERLIRGNVSQVQTAHQILCVGTMNIIQSEFTKNWFFNSDLKYHMYCGESKIYEKIENN